MHHKSTWITDANLHRLMEISLQGLQEEGEGSYLPPIYTPECLSRSPQFFTYRLVDFLSLITRKFSASFYKFLSWE